MRIGHGYDVHRFCEGDYVVIGGVKIPYEKKLLAHSDGDVLAHAIADSLLGAAGQRDIGFFFPDNDQKYKNIDSKISKSELKNQILAIKNKIFPVRQLKIFEDVSYKGSIGAPTFLFFNIKTSSAVA